jgi:hypothetical protein
MLTWVSPKEEIAMHKKRNTRLQKSLGYLACAVALSVSAGASTQAIAQSNDADKILKAMSDYVSSQRTISASVDTSIEIVSHDLQKIQFTSSGQVMFSRPDKLHLRRTGGYANTELFFDGKTFSIQERDRNIFMQAEAAGSVDELVQRLRDEFQVDIPGADLLLSKPYDQLIEGVVDAKHVGQGVIDGVECEHLAFRTLDTDWQIWVEIGPRPIPRQYVITSKGVTAAPQYTLRIKSWQTDVAFGPDTFVFRAPPNARKVESRDLAEIDEVPPGFVMGDKK